jgi:hypothetical protein
MFVGNRPSRKPVARRRARFVRRLRGEGLEDRTLLTVDLGGNGATASPLIATAPLGFAFGGENTTGASDGAGWSVSDLGNVNGSGFDSFLVGAPTVTSPTALGATGIGTAYLIFGSQTTGATTIQNWIGTTSSGAFTWNTSNRVANLSQFGTSATQTNPITGANLPLPFAAIAFQTTAQLGSQLGASAASVPIGNNTFGILIGAPNGLDASGNNNGAGRAYFITSTNWNAFVGQTIDLDTPTAYSGLSIYTFVTSSAGAKLGYSVAGGDNIFGDSNGDIILGSPSASFGTTGGTGAVFALSTAALPSPGTDINVSTIGQTGTNSAVFVGAAAGAEAGWSVADGGNVNGVTSSGLSVDDLLIGAPSQGSGGSAYLIYGGTSLAGLAQSTTVNGVTVRYINLANVGAAAGTTGAVPGATIVGPGGSETGWAVSSGGDFNADGFDEILIGSPEFSSSSSLTDNGLATLFYGATSGATGYLSGTITLISPPTGIAPLYMTGALSGALAGYALSQVGFINAGQPGLILIGSPGYTNNGIADAGTAYLIPGRTTTLSGTESLAEAESSPLSGVQFFASTPAAPTTSPPFFGASVSGRYQTAAQASAGQTADSDDQEDFIIGAPGYDVTQTSGNNLAGGAMIVQGGLITVPIPSSAAITTTIGVGTPFAPFTISASTPANLQIYVFGTTTPNGNFEPVTDIDPTTVVVNGVAFPTATLTPDPNTADYVNGIQDAIITITPRSNLNLTAGTTTITISGSTLASSPLPNETWTGSASVTVTGSSSGTSTSLAAVAAGGPILETTFNAPFGATQSVPTISALSAYNYAPIPLSVALQQYLPPAGFNERIYSYNHDGKHLKNYLTIRGPAATGLWGYGAGGPGPSGLDDKKHGIPLFVNNQILDRSRFHTGKTYTYTHKAPNIDSIYKGVVPRQLTTQSVSITGVPTGAPRQIGRIPTSGPTFRAQNRGSGE